MMPIIGITADMDEQTFRLRQDYVTSILNAGGLPLIIPSYLNSPPMRQIADFIDGLLIPGGDDLSPEYYGENISVPLELLKIVKKERSDFEMALLKEVMKRRKPILGICYGMQIVNVALGGDLYQDIGVQIKGAINHRSGQHDIKVFQPSTFNLQLSTVIVNSTHHQAIKKLADNFEVFAAANDNIIEGIYMRDYPFLVCVQWHPERDSEIGVHGSECDTISLQIFRAFTEQAKAV